jgi:hypothetical protein
MKRHVPIEERQARLGRRHFLAAPAGDVTEAAGGLCGLHSSDPVTVYLSAWARVQGFTHDALEAALYTDRRLLRMLGMRRTMFVVPRDLAAVMDAACTRHLLAAERRRLVGMLEDQDLAENGDAWLAEVERATLAAIDRRGEATAMELRKEVPELQEQLVFGEGKKWGGTFGVSTRVLFLLATDGQIVRARPLGTWISSQYRWATTERWIGELPSLDTAPARSELARRWLAAFGPGTELDLKWWTGWTVRDTRSALAAANAVEVALDGATGYVLPDDVDPVPAPSPWVALLPSLDPTVMGWKERRWYVGHHEPELFDRNGNAGPTVWVDGRIVGGWAQRPDGEVAVHLLEDVGAEAAAGVAEEAARLTEWLGDTRITPRFRTPVEKRITG